MVLVLQTGEEFFHFTGGCLHLLLFLTKATVAPRGIRIRKFIAAYLHKETMSKMRVFRKSQVTYTAKWMQ